MNMGQFLSKLRAAQRPAPSAEPADIELIGYQHGGRMQVELRFAGAARVLAEFTMSTEAFEALANALDLAYSSVQVIVVD